MKYLGEKNFKPHMLKLMINAIKRCLAFIHGTDMTVAADKPDTYDPAYEEGLPSLRKRQDLAQSNVSGEFLSQL